MGVSDKRNPKNGAYYWTHRVNGRLIRKDNKIWKTKKLARADYEEFLKTLDEDGYQFKATFKEMVADYMRYCSTGFNKPSTVSKKKYIIKNHILPFWEEYDPRKITVKDIDKFQAFLLKRMFKRTKKSEPEFYSNGMLEKIQFTLKGLFDYGTTRDFMRKNPFDLTKIKTRNQVDELLGVPLITLEDFEKLLSVIKGRKYRAFFALSYWIGCRPGEALGLNIEDYDVSTCMIKINKNWDSVNQVIVTTKTNVNREVYVPKRAREELEPYIVDLLNAEGVCPSMPLFQPTGRIAKTTIRNTMIYYCDKANLPHFTPMSFRHSNVTLLAEKGLKDYEIAQRTGHSVETLNQYYKHIFERRQREINDKIDSICD